MNAKTLQHVEKVCREAGLEVMIQVYEIAEARGEVPMHELTGLSAQDVTDDYYSFIGPAIDQIEEGMKPMAGEET